MLAPNLVKAYMGRIKTIDWTDDFVRRNPLIYNRVHKVFNWLGQASLEQRQEWVRHRLSYILGKALRTEYGRKKGRGLNIEDWPILGKTELRDNPAAFLKPSSFFAAPANTSGTTGIPLQLFRSPLSVVVEQICIDNFVRVRNCDLRKVRMAALKGDNIKSPSDMEPPYWKFSQGGRRLLLSSNHLSLSTVEHYHNVLREYKPQCMMAYPTSVESLSKYLLQTGRSLHVPLVITSSEVLTPRARELTERALGCEVIEYYGQSERVAFAYSFRKNEFYFLPGYAYIELELSAAEKDYKLYEIIGTPLWNTAMPLIRYRTGDLIRVPANVSERELERIRYGIDPFPEIVGRTDDWYLDSPEGVRLMGIPHIARDAENVLQMQIVQESLDHVRFLVVPAAGFSDKDVRTILDNAALKLPNSMKLEVECVSELYRTRQGKIPFVIRQWEKGSKQTDIH